MTSFNGAINLERQLFSSTTKTMSLNAYCSRTSILLLPVVLVCVIQFLHIVVINKSQNGSLMSPRTLTLETFVVNNTRSNTAIPPSFDYTKHKFCLIHVGKAAGSLVSCELGYIYAPECKRRDGQASSRNNHTSSILQDFCGGVRHMGMKVDCTSETNDDSVFIVTLRNPVQRLVSWYKYEHLQNARIQMNPKVKRGISCLNKFHKYRDNNGCFASLNHFAMSVLPPNVGNNIDECQELAWNVASGHTPCIWHNHMGYQYYMNIIEDIMTVSNTSKHHLLVMRAEHLQQDWESVEMFFGGNGNLTNTNFQTRLNKSQRRQDQEDTLSNEGTRNLCRALCQEIQVYKELLARAENLTPKMKKESMVELLETCPEESNEIRACETYKYDSLA